MPIQLTPEQRAALLLFQRSSEDAEQATVEAVDDEKEALAAAQTAKEQAAVALDRHCVALSNAKDLIDLLVAEQLDQLPHQVDGHRLRRPGQLSLPEG